MAKSVIDEDGLVDVDYIVDVFKALGHPMRLEIMRQMMSIPELACTALEESLPISKPTISYHVKILSSARLVNVRKAGKFYFYTPRLDEIERLLPGFTELMRSKLRA
jgi:DNA-binding transcriptional ArsR family regulator